VFYVEFTPGTFRSPPSPREGVNIGNDYEYYRYYLSNICSPPILEPHEFAALYDGRRRKMNNIAADSLMLTPLTRKDSYVEVFGKVEKTNFTAKPNAIQRVISPTIRRYLVETGRHIKPLEKPLIKRIDQLFGETTVFKGLDPFAMGYHLHCKWSRFGTPVAIGIDAKRFDQHVSVPWLEFEHSIYNSIIKSKYLKRILRWQLKTKCFARCKDGTIKYTLVGTRTSGCINTALGNVIINCVMVHKLCTRLCIPFSLVNNGDDSVIITEKKYEQKLMDAIPGYFLDYGFTMKVEKPVYEFEQIEFCQMQPVFAHNGYRMTRQIGPALSKDIICAKPMVTMSLFKRWLYVVGQGGLSLTYGVPIMQEFYLSLIRNGTSSNSKRLLKDPVFESGFFRMVGKCEKHGPVEVTDQARLSFWLAFGVTPDTQRDVEEYYRSSNLTYAPCAGRKSIFIPTTPSRTPI